jgi:hypothetical protein
MKTSARTFVLLIMMGLSLISLVALAKGMGLQHELTSEEKVN